MPYNNPIKNKGSVCKQLKSEKGKPTGLMMEGSVNHMSMLHQQEEPSKRTQRIREKREKLDDKFLDGKISEEKYARKESRTRKRLEKSKEKDKESALEMSPYKMSPLNDNHWKIDPKTGKKVDEFGTEIPEGFVSDAPDAGVEASNIFFDRQRRADEALNIAQNLLTGGASANLGHIATDYPSAAGHIVGKTYDDRGYLDTSVDPTQANIDRLRELNRARPDLAFQEISARTRGATLGDAHDDWKMEVDPLNQFERMRSGWRNKKRKTLGASGQTLYEKTMANRNNG
jgi:hypothetical protein